MSGARALRILLLLAAPVACLACQLITGLDDLHRVKPESVDVGASRSDAGSGLAGAGAIQPGAGTVRGGVSCEKSAAGCDPVAQCGCPAGQHCQQHGAESSCVTPGSSALGSSCSDDSECAAGSGCLDRLCKRYCQSDADCREGACLPAQPASGEDAEIKACLTRCDLASERPCASGARCARLSAASSPGVDGDFCVAPSTSCETDQRCDEPEWGTRRCVTGSDAADCTCQRSVPDATCDPISQCGCSPDMHCALLATDGTRAFLECVPDIEAPRRPGEPCGDERDCSPGYSCWRGLCEKYCTEDADCAGASCLAIRDPQEVAGVRICAIACEFATEQGCATGSRCVHGPDAHDYCLLPRSPCPLAADGVCDEPEGTRICVDGSDPDDCP